MPDFSASDRDMMIRTVIGEADDQSPAGQAAVAHVILNRVRDGRWGDTPSNVVLARGQFEPWSTRAKELTGIKPDSPRYQQVADVIDDVLAGRTPDPTGGATHFLQPDIVQRRRGSLPDWASGPGLRIGDHVFYKPDQLAGVVAPQEDLIGEWAFPAAGTASPRTAPPTAANVPAGAQEDLVGEWASPTAAALGKPAPAGAIPSPSIEPGSHETLPEFINRITREAHGHGDRNLDSWGDTAIRTATGLGRGVGHLGDTLAQGITWTGEKGANALSSLGVISPESAKAVADWRSGINADITRQNQVFEEAWPGTAGHIGEIGGEITATAPLLGAGGHLLMAATRGSPIANFLAARPLASAAVRGAGIGGGTNLLTSASSDAPLSEQVGTGSVVGTALGPFAHGVGKLVGAGIDQETAQLAQLARNKFGIPIRIDQTSGNPMVRFAGSVMQRAPFTGLGSHVAEQQGAFNRAVANTFGEDIDKITPGVMAGAKARIGNVFDTTLPQLEAHLNPNTSARIQAIADATQYLPQEDARIINKHLDDVINQFTGVSGRVGAPTRAVGAARMDGKQLQALITKGSPLDRAITSGSSNVKYLASELKDTLLDSVGQTATGRAKTAAAYVQKLQAYNQARLQYKNMKTIEDLAEKSTTGDISPALLMGQVRQSFGNMAYGGGGDLAELARIGQRFLKEPPSSGTAERLATMKILGALGAGAGGIGLFDSEHFQRDAALAAAGLLAARTGGAALKNQLFGNLMTRSAARGNPPGRFNELLGRTLPALAPRQNPLALPSPAQ